MRVAHRLPAVHRTWSRLEGSKQVAGRTDLARLRIEVETHLDDLTALEACGFAVAPSERNERRSTHCGDRAAVRVAVERDLHRDAHFAEDRLRIEGQRDRRHRA